MPAMTTAHYLTEVNYLLIIDESSVHIQYENAVFLLSSYIFTCLLAFRRSNGQIDVAILVLTVKVYLEEVYELYMSLVVRKPVFEVSDQVRHKPGCTATEDV